MLLRDIAIMRGDHEKLFLEVSRAVAASKMPEKLIRNTCVGHATLLFKKSVFTFLLMWWVRQE